MATSATLMLHLTGRCNLECRHCYMDGSPRRKETLPFAWIEQALRSAPQLGIGSLFLTGGEPLLYPRFAEVAQIAADVPGLATTVCTNATVVRRRHVELFSRIGCKVHVSIDGAPAYHDDFRAVPGAFGRAERGVRMLVDAGVPVTIVTTISRQNIDTFEGIASWALNAGATSLLVQPLLDLGRGSALRQYQLSSAQLNRLIMQTSDVANMDPDMAAIKVGTTPAARIPASIIGSSKRHLLAHPCAAYVCNGGGCHRKVAAEIKKVVVREDGTILPEATNLDHRYAIGSVDDGPLDELIPRYFADGYARFDRLCRTTYEELVLDWPAAIVPWDQLIALRSRTALPDAQFAQRGCGGKTSAPIWLAPAPSHCH